MVQIATSEFQAFRGTIPSDKQTNDDDFSLNILAPWPTFIINDVRVFL